MVKYIATLLVLLSISSTAYGVTKVTASVDKNPVIANESFVLTVTADDDVNANALDTSSLSKSFIVGRTNVQRQTSVMNFNATSTTTWSTVLIAKDVGEKTIPALDVDGIKTNPINITVIAADDKRAQKQQDIFITTDISKSTLYVQQLLTLTVKLHFASELKSGTLTEPKLDDAKINQIGKDVERQDVINGKRYRIIERTFSISPQKSGQFSLQPPTFSGEIMESSGRRGNFYSFANTKPVTVLSKPIDIEVKPIPANYQGTWLPSELVALHQEWQPKDKQFFVGEPITNVLTLTAVGLSEEQLPKLDITPPKGLRIYPDQPELHTGLNQGRLVSQKVKSFALVASQPGTYQLPEIKIPWWNTITNKLEWATINGKTITVKANPHAQDTAINQEPVSSVATAQNDNSQKTIYITENSWLQWLFLALWILTTIAWLATFLHYRKGTPKLPASKKNIVDKTVILRACQQNNAQLVYQALLPWLNQHFEQPKSSLDQALSALDNDELSKAVGSLQRALFGQQSENWDSKDLTAAIKSIDLSKTSQKKSSLVTSLNP